MTTTPLSPPPCNQACWTWVGHRDAHGWTYTHRADACGHLWDGHGWVWNEHRDPNQPATRPHRPPARKTGRRWRYPTK